MAHTKFKVEVLTPEGEVFNDEVTQVSTKTLVGSIGLLAGHEPVLAQLEPCELRLYVGDGGDVVRFAQAEGYLQVSPDQTLVLVEEAIEPSELDAAELRERVKTAESELSGAEEGSEARAKAERDKRRAEAFLAIAEG